MAVLFWAVLNIASFAVGERNPVMELMDISSAPRDGIKILVVNEYGYNLIWFRRGDEVWYDGDIMLPLSDFTHWMNLPPQSKEQS
jgi:hypothetical protein